jgi:hypothetical protein
VASRWPCRKVTSSTLSPASKAREPTVWRDFLSDDSPMVGAHALSVELGNRAEHQTRQPVTEWLGTAGGSHRVIQVSRRAGGTAEAIDV